MKQKPNIVVNKNTPNAMQVFSSIGNVIGLDTQETTREAVREAEILIVRSEVRIDSNLLEGSRVRFVGTVTSGIDHVDTGYLASKGIVFAHAAGSNANSVAEYIAAALLHWSGRTGKGLAGKTIGVVGIGNVGSRVVEVAKIFGMHVLMNDPPRARATRGNEFRPLDDLMEADIVTLHVPLTASGGDHTYHLFDAERISRMKRGAVLINTARGAVADTEPLRDALASGHLSAAILDVWEGEPAIDTPLMDLAMLATPHIAGYSLDGKLNALRMVYEEVCKFLGIKKEWNVSVDPPREVACVRVDRNLVDSLEICGLAVRRAYDIELDDRLLRRISSIKDGQRYFREMRANYRVRREFPNWTLDLSRPQLHARPLLGGLGFRTRAR